MKNNKDTIIKLYFIEKLIPADIATKLNISKSAVTQTLQKDERYKIEKELRKEQNQVKHKENTNNYIKMTRKKKKFKNIKSPINKKFLKNIFLV